MKDFNKFSMELVDELKSISTIEDAVFKLGMYASGLNYNNEQYQKYDQKAYLLYRKHGSKNNSSYQEDVDLLNEEFDFEEILFSIRHNTKAVMLLQEKITDLAVIEYKSLIKKCEAE
jgi:hypothetical protein